MNSYYKDEINNNTDPENDFVSHTEKAFLICMASNIENCMVISFSLFDYNNAPLYDVATKETAQ